MADDCDGKLKVVDKLSPELKVDPQQLKSIFQSPNHTVPVKVMPTTVIKIQILVPNSNIVSLHMFVDYIKEIQLVFLDVNGNPIKDGVRAHSYSNLWIDIVECFVKVLLWKFGIDCQMKKIPSYFWRLRLESSICRHAM